MTTYVTRSQWGARSPSGSYNELSSTPKGSAIHWEGGSMGTFPHSECDNRMRSIQAFHMDERGWSDIAYNLVGCPHDYVFEGRGKGKGSAANGTTQANYDWYAICALVGENDPQPPELIKALQYGAKLCRDWGAGSGSVGHRDLYNTACPGDKLYAEVQKGTFKSGGSSGGSTPEPKPPATAPKFPYPSSDYLGRESSDPHCHSGYYSSDRPNIKTWQQQMKNRGWTIGVDGYYGDESYNVCRQFQDEKNLAVDGLVGPTTWSNSWTSPVT